MGVSPYRTISIMPEIIKEFSVEYPNFKVILEERTGRELLDGAEHGEYDFCITTAPVDGKIFDSVKKWYWLHPPIKRSKLKRQTERSIRQSISEFLTESR